MLHNLYRFNELLTTYLLLANRRVLSLTLEPSVPAKAMSLQWLELVFKIFF